MKKAKNFRGVFDDLKISPAYNFAVVELTERKFLYGYIYRSTAEMMTEILNKAHRAKRYAVIPRR